MSNRETELALCLQDALDSKSGWELKAKDLLGHPVEWGCFVEAVVGEDVDATCVLDTGDVDDCIYAKCGYKHKCKYWAPKNAANLIKASCGENPTK